MGGVCGGGLCVCDRGHVWWWGGGMHGRGACMAGGYACQIPRDTVNERAVRILLECILVYMSICTRLQAIYHTTAQFGNRFSPSYRMFAAMNKQRFFRAAENGNYERLGALIQEGADVNVTNSKGDTALLLAVQQGYDKCMDFTNKSRS